MRDLEEFIPTRQSLLSRLRDLDDQESWRVFFETYWKLILRTAMRAGLTEAEAQDVVQETVISVSKNIQKFEYDPVKGSFKQYLLKLTNWRIRGQFRKRLPVVQSNPRPGTDTEVEGIDEMSVPVLPELESLWDEEWEENLVEAALQRVKAKTDPKFYQVYDLYVRQKWPVAKVAKDLRVTKAKVYLAKHLVGKTLKKEMEKLRNMPI